MELGPDNFKKHYWLHIPHPKVDWEDAREKVINMEVRGRSIPDQTLKAMIFHPEVHSVGPVTQALDPALPRVGCVA